MSSQKKKPLEEKAASTDLQVAIVGYASSSKDKAPWEDKSWEIWALNDLYRDIPRFDRWFQMHDRDVIKSPHRRDPNHLAWLMNAPCPVYMQEAYPDIPNSVRFPLEEIGQKYPYIGKYFTNSIAYMIALAVFMGAKKIALFGVDMLQDTEYAGQRACCEAWLGFAAGLGIEVHVPIEAALLKTAYLYGYQEKSEGGWPVDWMEKEAVRLRGEHGRLSAQIGDIQAKAAFVNGAQHQMQFLLQHAKHHARGGSSLTSAKDSPLVMPYETVRARISRRLGLNIPDEAWGLMAMGGVEKAVEYGELTVEEVAQRFANLKAEVEARNAAAAKAAEKAAAEAGKEAK